MGEPPHPARRLARLKLAASGDVVRARQAVLREMKSRHVSALRMTRFATAVSEIARNAVVYGGGGEISIFITADEQYLVVKCQDHGPGIGNLEQAMQDGYTSRDGLGRGLGGAKRLSDTFDIRSAPGDGTVVTMSCRV